jgi:hypothetical protein
MVLDSAGQQVPLERVHPSEGRRTLGLRAAPDGSQKAELQFLRDVTRTWAHRTRLGGGDRTTAWLGLNSTLLRKLAYPLPATCFTPKQCHHIMSPVRKCLPTLVSTDPSPMPFSSDPSTSLAWASPTCFTPRASNT